MSASRNHIDDIAAAVIRGEPIEKEGARALAAPEVDMYDLMHGANRIRAAYRGNKVDLCSIVNARSGRCDGDCKFCAQSAHYPTSIEEYPLLEPERILERALRAAENGAHRFGIVTSGTTVAKEDELTRICEAVTMIKNRSDIHVDASLGILDPETASVLKEAGLNRYHHNLETSERFFASVCSTHAYGKRTESIYAAREAGLEVCCGGLFGIGETWEDRIDMAMTIRALGVKSVPLNFLRPVAGTPLEHQTPLKPFEILRIIALYRFILPDKEIRIAGGRESNLRDVQSWIYYAGANGVLLGDYLTTPGKLPREDLRMIDDLELTASR